MTERITFAQLETILAELGFAKSIIPGSHVNYEHPEVGMLAPVRLHQAREAVPSYVVATVRHDLEVLGVITGSEFEQMLKVAAA